MNEVTKLFCILKSLKKNITLIEYNFKKDEVILRDDDTGKIYKNIIAIFCGKKVIFREA